MKLEPDHVAVVTGAGGGIGSGLALALAARGLRLVLADVEAEALERTRADVAAVGAEVFACRTDVSDAAAVEALAAMTEERFGGVDLLVNNAGVGGAIGPLWQLDPNDWTWTFGVNVMGVVNGVSAFLPRMLRLGRGHIVNVASLAGLSDPPFLSPYVATKRAVVGISESLAGELSAMGCPVRVSVACPGAVRSGISRSDRNRPADLAAHRTPSPALKARLEAAFGATLVDPMEPSDFARRLIDGIEGDLLYIFSHENSLEAIEKWLARISAAVADARRTLSEAE